MADAALAVGQQAGRAVVVHGQRGLTLALLLAVEHVTDQLAAAVAHTQLGAVLLAAVLAGRRLQTVVLPEQTERTRILVTACRDAGKCDAIEVWNAGFLEKKTD